MTLEDHASYAPNVPIMVEPPRRSVPIVIETVEPPFQPLIAWILWMGCICGFAGFHRCYLGKYITGVIWFFTWGLCGLGLLIDACFMDSVRPQLTLINQIG
jgi:TM2 domain-containing membrane protein YozV